jgi:hypothetical protein
MDMKRKIFFTTVTCFLVHSMLWAQRDYTNSLGLRVAPSSGLTYKHFLSEKAAFEGLFTTRWQGINLTGLYELHQDVFDNTRFNFYYGIGGHFGFWSNDNGNPWFNNGDDYIVAGVDAIVGLEYTFESIPFNISIDWKPAFNIVTDPDFWVDEMGFSMRYIIK